jgi:hypothetical protein
MEKKLTALYINLSSDLLVLLGNGTILWCKSK